MPVLDVERRSGDPPPRGETYPYECCGALIAAGDTIVEAFRLPNTTAEGARRRFLIGPEDYRDGGGAGARVAAARWRGSIIRIPIIPPGPRRPIWRRPGRT